MRRARFIMAYLLVAGIVMPAIAKAEVGYLHETEIAAWGRNVEGQVSDPEDRIIPGLYGAGRATSGVSVGGFSSGLSLGDGSFFGRRAARAATRRARQG